MYLRTPNKKKRSDRIHRIKTGLTRFLISKILNPVGPEKSC
jgi:hypothetical protein